MKRHSALEDIVQQFVSRLQSFVEEDAVARARDVVLSAFGGRAPAGLRAPRAIAASSEGTFGRRKRRKGPIQLCPVPGCSNRAAPVFGMVCSKHKDLPKSEIKKYREQRRDKKQKEKKTKKVGKAA
jgi:hypothetical protein